MLEYCGDAGMGSSFVLTFSRASLLDGQRCIAIDVPFYRGLFYA